MALPKARRIERFKEACREMGQVLSSASHTLVVGSDSTNSADIWLQFGLVVSASLTQRPCHQGALV